MSILDALPHRATAKIRTRTADAIGGAKDSFAIVFSDRECWQQAASAQEENEYGKRGIVVTDKVYFTSDPALDEQHILIIGSTTFEVRSRPLPDASVGLGYVWRVMVENSTTGGTEDED